MKRIIMLIVISLITTSLYAQKVATQIEKVSNYKLSIEQLDEAYQNALNSNSDLAVFKTEPDQTKFLEAYKSMLSDLGKYLKKNKFIWGKPTKSFNKVYFEKNGSISYFFYHFYPNEITPEKEVQFNTLINNFIKLYKLGISANSKFSQNSPVQFLDAK